MWPASSNMASVRSVVAWVAVIDVGMRQDEGVDRNRLKREVEVSFVGVVAAALVEAAIQQQSMTVDPEQMARASHRLSGPMKRDLHLFILHGRRSRPKKPEDVVGVHSKPPPVRLHQLLESFAIAGCAVGDFPYQITRQQNIRLDLPGSRYAHPPLAQRLVAHHDDLLDPRTRGALRPRTAPAAGDCV